MNAISTLPERTASVWQRLLNHNRVMRVVEIATILALIAMIALSYFVLTDEKSSVTLLTPQLVALLLVANLVPAMALMVLFARRRAQKRAAESEIGGRGRLHTRLVALFSAIAAIPTVLVVIFASLLFQSGIQFWFSDRARSMLENASVIAQQTYDRELNRVNRETIVMAGDVTGYLQQVRIDDPLFAEGFGRQVLNRNLSESVILNSTATGSIQSLALVNPYERELDKVITPSMIAALRSGRESVIVPSNDRIGVLTTLPLNSDTYLYAARVLDPQMTDQLQRGQALLADYQALLNRSRAYQFRFNAALLVVSLLIVGLSIWIALALADRLVRPVGALVGAARRITAGDLTARVPVGNAKDEVGTLGDAFNQMTQRLEEQTGALVSANSQLDTRRAFTEAVLSGVTAGVLSIDECRRILLINKSAENLLKAGEESPVGRTLGDLAPELGEFVAGDAREATVEVAQDGEPRTLAVKRVKVTGGYVLTFDDITDQLLDQRQAAWSDVARRIAHEIKNPLTPIQLAAERLQRRFGSQIVNEPEMFARLTQTIVRQVGDLRRMVDEFSGFARMPKPVFREENIADIARETLFLHEVAHPGIRFALDAPEEGLPLICDRQQIGQALTNLVKNAIEAIEAQRIKGARDNEEAVTLTIADKGDFVLLNVCDTGVGLPADRARMTEPYMTTRVRGTGLGLAIVKKILEEHCGEMTFHDRAGGGSDVRICFDVQRLARLASGETRTLTMQEVD